PRPVYKLHAAAKRAVGNAEKQRQRKYAVSKTCASAGCSPSAMIAGAIGTRASMANPASTLNQIDCQTTGPTRSGRPAPVYCATNVVAYEAVWKIKLNGVQKRIAAGMAAPTSAELCRLRRIRSSAIC